MRQQFVLKKGTHLFNTSVSLFVDKHNQLKLKEGQQKLKITFPWHRSQDWVDLKDEIKSWAGARFFEDKYTKEKMWLVDNCQRNWRLIDWLDSTTPDPFAKYVQPFPIYPVQSERYGQKLREYQIEDASEIIHKRQMILAADMGTGKTLTAITVLDMIHPQNAWYVGPAFALPGIRNQFLPRSERNPGGWGCSVLPQFMSYEEMVSRLKKWKQGALSPDALVLDESIYVKTPDSVRSMYAQALADGMRTDWSNPLILLMSGSPTPKAPSDYWNQMEVCCPGFIKESNIYRFEERLALMEEKSAISGGKFKKVVTWWDDEKKCAKCGQLEEEDDHQSADGVHFHRFVPSKNEVDALYQRLKPVARVRLKKDILPELPDFIYRQIDLEPDPATVRRLKLIVKGAATTIEALTLARELSDGFRYETIESDTQFEPCERCNGTLIKIEYDLDSERQELPCDRCDHGDGPTGQQRKEVKNTIHMPTPKDKALVELLRENEEQGRLVVYAGFTASIDRIVGICQKEGWTTIRADGSTSSLPHKCKITPAPKVNIDYSLHPVEWYFQNSDVDKIVFIAHPQTAKAGITLTRASMIVYYSNTFNFDDRNQSENRIHRLGMDVNKGATIVDLFHLPTDRYVFENLMKKKRMQSIVLGELRRALDLAA